MTTLVIVESPAKCSKIESFLGPGYKCMASFGHIQELSGLASIDFNNNFKPQFIPSPSKATQIEKLRKSIIAADDVLLATDDDREGEAIAWHICELFNLDIPTTKRIIFHEITKTAIQNAVANPSRLNMNVVYAQQARQILDLIVGFKISPILWKNIVWKSKNGLSAGRCQTPALRLVYDNQKDIEQSPGKIVYNTTGYFTKMNLPMVLNHNFEKKETTETFLENSVSHDHIFSKNPVKKTTKKPPTPFTTSTLQQTASNELHINPKDTMSICQTLYEQGYITYMRTDSTTYSKEFIESAKIYIKDNFGAEYVNKEIDLLNVSGEKKTKKSKKENDVQAQEAHEAIRPTKIDVKQVKDDMNPREKKMYLLIWKNTVSSCMENAEYKSLTVKMTAPEKLEYKYTCEQVVFPGWKKIMGYEEENKEFSYLKTIKQETKIDYNKITSKMTMKELKMHYTEAKLVQMLEKKGIGRPSTFSSLIDKIQERGYALKQDIVGKKVDCIDFELVGDELDEIVDTKTFGNEKNKLVVQPVGILVLEFLTKNFSNLFDYDYTMNMEKELDIIAKGDSVWHRLCNKCNEQIEAESEPFKTDIDKFSYDFDDKHSLIIGKYGPVIKKTVGKEVKFIKVIEDLDLDKVRQGIFKMEDILYNKKSEKILGKYKNEYLTIKNGKYGLYATWGSNHTSLKDIDKPIDEISLEDVKKVIDNAKKSPILRRYNDELSLRTGQYGPYVFYKTEKMKKPKFYTVRLGPDEDIKDTLYMKMSYDKFITWFKKSGDSPFNN